MSSAEAAVGRLLDLMARNRAVLYAAVGVGLCRACLGWILSLIRLAGSASLLPLAAHHLVGIGEVALFAAAALIVSRRPFLRSSGAVYLFPAVAVPLGCACGAASTLAPEASAASAWALGLSCLLVGGGFALLFVCWLERLGLFAPRTMLVGFSLGYMVNLAMWLAMRGSSVPLGAVLCACCSLASVVLLTASSRAASTGPAASGAAQAAEAPRSPFPTSLVSPRLLAWVIVFSVAYGVGDSITHMGYTTLASKFGMAVPDALVLLCVWLMPDRFELSVLSRATFALMLVGLLGALLPGSFAGLSQVLMSAANESFEMFALMTACYVAYRNRASSAFYCAVIMALQTLSVRAGVLAGGALAGGATAAYAGVLVLVILSGTFLLREGRMSEQLHLGAGPGPVADYAARAAEERGLSRREQDVLVLLGQGRSYEEIAEELFIAPGTVRAHCSRIFEKFGVHTRAELERALRDGASYLR